MAVLPQRHSPPRCSICCTTPVGTRPVKPLSRCHHRAAALLVVLATEGGWRAQQLAAVFWPEATPEDARHHLRINLHRAQRADGLGVRPRALEAERHRVRLTAPSRPRAFGRHRHRAQHPGPWLQGWHLGGYEGFPGWRVAAQRCLLDRWQRATVQTPSTAPK